MLLHLIYRKKNPTAFSIERLFAQLAEEFARRGVEVNQLELPHYNNTIGNVRKNRKWARTQVQSKEVNSGAKNVAVKHVTGDVTSVLFGMDGPTVLTIHDCNPLLRYSKLHPRYWFYRWVIYEWPVRYADAVTVISDKTREEVMALTSCPAGKLEVIPNFVDPAFTHQPKPFDKEMPTILQVGVKKNKNIAKLAEALQGVTCKLQIIGKPSEEDTALLERFGINYTWAAGVSDEVLRQHYADCDLLSFVSTYEGFGLPILEAQITGRPVITSDISPHREVAGPGGAVLADPQDPEAIRQGLRKIIEDDAFRERLLNAGRKNAQQYEIGQIAQRYIDLYERISQKS